MQSRRPEPRRCSEDEKMPSPSSDFWRLRSDRTDTSSAYRTTRTSTWKVDLQLRDPSQTSAPPASPDYAGHRGRIRPRAGRPAHHAFSPIGSPSLGARADAQATGRAESTDDTSDDVAGNVDLHEDVPHLVRLLAAKSDTCATEEISPPASGRARGARCSFQRRT